MYHPISQTSWSTTKDNIFVIRAYIGHEDGRVSFLETGWVLCVRECSFAMVSNVDRTMVDANSRRFSIDVSHCKIIEDFPRLLNSVGKSRIGEEEGTYTIHKFLPSIQQLWHLIAIHPNSCCIVKLFHTVMKNGIWGYIFARNYLHWGPLVDVNQIDQQ